MPTYNLGTLNIVSHDASKLTEAIGIPEHRFDDLVQLARSAWDYEDTISESIEYVAQRVTGSEAVLALIILGRIWEQNSDNK
ncbi:MAG: hypothetical protein GF411_09700 [Candidatus Lokiarchaeota archaeon]|nr:hypothetical protein [Candidatus Lokiarchaeota archaeon]